MKKEKAKNLSPCLVLQANAAWDLKPTHPFISHAIACRCEMSRSERIYLWLFLILILSGFLILILWLILRPSAPSDAIVDLSIPAVNGTENTTIFFGLEVSNHNSGGGVYHSDMNVTLYLFDGNARDTTLPSFYQGHRKTTTLRGAVNAGHRLSEAVARAVMNGTTQLTMGLVTQVKYKTLWWWGRFHGMVEQVSVTVGKDGKVKQAGMHRTRRKRKPC